MEEGSNNIPDGVWLMIFRVLILYRNTYNESSFIEHLLQSCINCNIVRLYIFPHKDGWYEARSSNDIVPLEAGSILFHWISTPRHDSLPHNILRRSKDIFDSSCSCEFGISHRGLFLADNSSMDSIYFPLLLSFTLSTVDALSWKVCSIIAKQICFWYYYSIGKLILPPSAKP